tara:strand:- start:11972 stop:13036 length:1065 start_codon:yes stop_codon:yes gene_type:complete
MNEILVSICCQTYNHVGFIEKAVESFLMQKTDFRFEILIRDDASTDGTTKIVQKYAFKFPELIKLLTYEENQYKKGVKPFPDNVRRAQGKYIAICEGDDYWTDTLKLQKQADFLENNKEYGMVHTNFDTYYQNDNYFLKNTHSVYNIDLKDNCTLDYWNFFGKEMATIKTLTVCFRNELLKKWQSASPKNNWLIGDFPMYFYISLQSKVGYINEPTAVHRTVFDGSASNVGKDNIKKLQLRKTYVDIRLHFLKKYNLDEKKFQKALIRDLNILLDFCIISDNKSILNKYLGIIYNITKQNDSNKLSRIYLKSNNRILKISIQYITKIKLFNTTYINKLFNHKFLISMINRKLLQ